MLGHHSPHEHSERMFKNEHSMSIGTVNDPNTNSPQF